MIAVLGSSVAYSDGEITAAFEVGSEIARNNKVLITGATTGVPYAAAIGAKRNGGTVIGISPADDYHDHIERFSKPADSHDLLIFTGMGYEGRNPIIVRSARAAIFIGGEFGTINEFAAAWTVGTPLLGILEGVGCVADLLQIATTRVRTRYGSTLIVESEPKKLARYVCSEIDRRCSLNALPDHGNDVGSQVRAIIDDFASRQSGGRRSIGAQTA